MQMDHGSKLAVSFKVGCMVVNRGLAARTRGSADVTGATAMGWGEAAPSRGWMHKCDGTYLEGCHEHASLL